MDGDLDLLVLVDGVHARGARGARGDAAVRIDRDHAAVAHHVGGLVGVLDRLVVVDLGQPDLANAGAGAAGVRRGQGHGAGVRVQPAGGELVGLIGVVADLEDARALDFAALREHVAPAVAHGAELLPADGGAELADPFLRVVHAPLQVVAGERDALLVGEIAEGLHLHRLAGAQRRDLAHVDRQQRGVADLELQHDRLAGGVAVVGLQGDAGHARKTRLGLEQQRAAVQRQPGRAVGGAEHAPVHGVAVLVHRHIVEQRPPGQVAVGQQRLAGGLGHRGTVGPEAVVGVEELAVLLVGRAVAVEVGQLQAAGAVGRLPGGGVGAVDGAVSVEVAGQRNAQAHPAVAGQRHAHEPGVGHAQQGHGAAAGLRTADDGGAFGHERGVGAAGLHRVDQRARGAAHLGCGGQFAVAHHEAEVRRRARRQGAAPGVARRGRGGGPVRGRAEVGGQGLRHQRAIGPVAQAEVERGLAVQRAHHRQPAGVVVAVDDGGGFAADQADDALDAAGAVALEGHALLHVHAAGHGDTGVADEPEHAVGKAHGRNAACGVQAVAGAVGGRELPALRHPRQAGLALEQPQALQLQGRRLHALVLDGAQRPAGRIALEPRPQHLRGGGVGRQRLRLRAQREGQLLRRRVGQRQRGGHLQPHAGALAPGGGGVQAAEQRLVVAELRRQQRQRPVAEVTDPGAGCRAGRLEAAHQCQRVAAEREGGVGGRGHAQVLGGGVDLHARADLAGAAAKVPGAQAQRQHAVRPQLRVQRGQREFAAAGRGWLGSLGHDAPGSVVDGRAAGRRGLQHPAHQLALVDACRQFDGRGQRDGALRVDSGKHFGECAAPGQGRRCAVLRVAHAQRLHGGVLEAVGVDGAHAQFGHAGGRGQQPQPAQGVGGERGPLRQAERGAAGVHLEQRDGAEALSAHGGQHLLPRQRRGGRGQVDEYARCIGLLVGHHAQREAAGDAVASVADGGQHEVVGHLAGARGPQKLAGVGVVARALGQPAERHRQRGGLCAAVGVEQAQAARRGGGAAHHIDGQGLPDEQRAAGRLDLRRAVDVEDAQLHRAVGGGAAVGGAEGEVEGTVAGGAVVDRVLVGRPLEVAGGGVEAHAGRGGVVVEQGQPHGVAVGVAGAQPEGQRLALGHELQRQRQQLRGLVGVAHAQLELARDAEMAVAGGDGEAVEAVAARAALGREGVGRPAQAQVGLAVGASHGLRHHGRGQAAELPVQQVQVGVQRRQVQRERHALVSHHDGARAGQRVALDEAAAGGHAQPGGSLVGAAHDDAQVGNRGVGRRRVGRVDGVAAAGRRQALVGDAELQVVAAQLCGRGRPDDPGLAVADALLQRGAVGQALHEVAELVLVEVADLHRQAELLAGHGHGLAGQGDDGRLAGAAHGEHEAGAGDCDLVDVAVAVVLRQHGDGVGAARLRTRGDAQHASHAAGGRLGLLVARERRQALDRQRDRVAVGIGGLHRQVQHRAALDAHAVQRTQLGRAVGVAHDDGQLQFAAGGRAGAVAVVGGPHRDLVAAGLGVARGPHHLERVLVEAGAGGKARDLVANSGGYAVAGAGRAAGQEADPGFEIGVVGVEGEDADTQRLPLQNLPGLGGVEARRAVGVAHLETDALLHGGAARAAVDGGVQRLQGDGQLEAAGLRVARRPGEPPGLGVECGAGRQPGCRPAERDTAAIGLLEPAGHAAGQLQPVGIALAQHLLRHGGEDRRGHALQHAQVEAPLGLVHAVAGHDDDVVVDARLGVARRPGQQLPLRIETRARRQVAQQQRDRLAVVVGGVQRQLQRVALGQHEVGHGVDHGCAVAAVHRQRQPTDGHAAAAVEHAHQHLGVGAVGGRGRPDQARALAVAGRAGLRRALRLQAQPGRRLQQLPEQLASVGVAGKERGAPGLAGAGTGQHTRQRGRRAAGGVDHVQRRGHVVVGHGVDAVAEVDLDQRSAGTRAQACRRLRRDDQVGQRLAAGQPAAACGQRVLEVDDPQFVLLAAAGAAADDLAAEIAARVEQQHEGPADLVGADVGDAEVVAHAAADALGARGAEDELHLAADVGGGREQQAPRRGQRDLAGAAQPRADLQPPAAGGQVRERQHR